MNSLLQNHEMKTKLSRTKLGGNESSIKRWMECIKTTLCVSRHINSDIRRCMIITTIKRYLIGSLLKDIYRPHGNTSLDIY